MLITILMLIFSKFMSFIFFWTNLVRKSEVLQINWYLGQAYIPLLVMMSMFIFPKFLSLIFFGGKFGHINWSCTKWLKFRVGVNCCMLITIFMFIFSNFLSVIFFWTNLVPKSNVLQIDWNLIQGHIVICWFWFWCVIF